MKKITTSKGIFVIKDYNNWSELIKDANFYKLELGKSIFKLSEITEEQASEIVDYKFECRNIGNYPPYKTALKFIIKKNNIEVTDNTYIFKL